MKWMLALLIATCATGGRAQIVSRDSLHLKPIGTTARGTFVLVNRMVPLPEGEFTLIAVEIRDSKLAYGDYAGEAPKLVDVALAQVVDGRLRVGVVATALLAQSRAR